MSIRIPLGAMLWYCFLSGSGAQAGDWPRYLLNSEHHSNAVDETLINKESVASLQLIWQSKPGAALAAAPIVVDGVVYVGAWDGTFFALDAYTGDVRWKTFVGTAPASDSDWCLKDLGVSASAEIYGETVLVSGGDSAVYALDRETGREVWRVQMADPATGSYLWTPPVVHDDQITIGIASVGGCPMVRGALARVALRGNTTPDDPSFTYLMPEGELGGGAWKAPARDPQTGAIYITTGNTEDYPDPEIGRYGGGLLKLSPDGVQVEAYYFNPSNLPYADLDWGSAPTLFTASDGTPLVAATGKDGVLYVNRRDDLSLVYSVQIAQGCLCPECGCGSLSTPAWDGQRLYVAGGLVPYEDDYYAGSAYALNPDTGEVQWMRHMPGTVIAPPTIAGGVLFLSTMSGLEALDCDTGETLWQAPMQGMLVSQAAIANGVVYSTWIDGTITAFAPRAVTAMVKSDLRERPHAAAR